jgi:rare lipoprotein A
MKVMHRKQVIFSLVFICICLSTYAQGTETGLASYYSDNFEGKKTASGEVYSGSKMTAAHRSLPFGTSVKVTNLSNNKSVTVTVNDRGPFVKDRIIDVSKAAAVKLDFIDQGVTKVKIESTSKKSKK